MVYHLHTVYDDIGAYTVIVAPVANRRTTPRLV